MVRPRLDVRLLGPVDLRFDGDPVRVDTRKAVALLAYLVVTGRPASRGVLAALLWPDSDDEGARGALRRTLSVLNGATGGAALQIDRTSVGLAAGAVRADVPEQRAAMATARSHAHAAADPCEPCLAALTRVAELDRGAFMDGFALRDSEPFEEWQRSEAEHHARDLGAALERLAAIHAAASRWGPALAAGRRWLELDPLHEPAHRMLMTIHARAGETGAAIAQYRECVAVLDRELGVAPLPETSELYEAIREGRIEPAGPPARGAPGGVPATAQRPGPHRPADLPLVGRDAALAAALEAYEGAATAGRTVGLVGEAGIGKTRLGAAVGREIAARGGRVLEAIAYAGEDGIAYGLVLALLRAGLALPGASDRLAALPMHVRGELALLAPGLDDGTGPVVPAGEGAATHLGLVDAIALALEALAAGDVPGLLSVDGLESADGSSLEALTYLVRRIAGRRLLFLAAWRPEDLSVRMEPFIRLLESSPDATIIRLDRLGRDDVVALVRASGRHDPAFGEALFVESEGLPLYVAEVLGTGATSAEALPGGVRALLRERLGSLEPVADQVLATAAVIGRTFELSTVRQASGRSEEETVDALDSLVRRGLVRELGLVAGTVRYDFTHRALRDAAYEATSLARRRLLHGRVADALRHAPARTPAERLERVAVAAGHEREGGRDTVAAELFAEAGQLARRLPAPREAITHFEAALALGHPDAAGLHLGIGAARILLGDYDPGIQALETAAALAPPSAIAVIELELGRAHARRGDLAAAASHLDAASAALGEAPDAQPTAAWLAAERAVVHSRLGAREEAAALAEEALRRAGGVGDAAVEAAAERAAGLVALAGNDLDAARLRLRTSIERSSAAGDAEAALAARNALAIAESAAGNHDVAIALLEDALAACRLHGSRHLEAALENNIADALHRAGRTEDSMAHLKRAASLFADVGGMPGVLTPDVWRLTSW